jgi:ornithine carbamoyltransferase
MPKRDFVSITDINRDEFYEIIRISRELKAELKQERLSPLLKNKTLAMIFMKPSLRTRCTFELGMYQLGGKAVYLAPSDIGIGKRESLYDVAKNLERWFHLIMARVFQHQTVLDFSRYAEIPVINALCDTEHPCQVMADFMAVIEHRGDLKDFALAYIGDGNNVCNSLILLSAILGTHIRVSSPKGYEPARGILEKAKVMFKKSGGTYEFFYDPSEAVKKAEAIYTDVWASMGQEHEAEGRKKIFEPYQVNSSLVSCAPEDVMIMHDLPAHRGEEITDEILDSENSVAFDQAENRLHAQKGILVFLHQNYKK